MRQRDDERRDGGGQQRHHTGPKRPPPRRDGRTRPLSWRGARSSHEVIGRHGGTVTGAPPARVDRVGLCTGFNCMVRKMLKSRLGTRVAGAVMALASVPLLAAACGNSNASAAGPGATVPRAAPTSTTSADPYAIPSPITAPYVQRVLNELEAINSEATLVMIDARTFTPEVARLFRSVSTAEEFRDQTQILLSQLDQGLPNYRPSPGPVRDTVNRLPFATNSCIFVGATRDYSALLTTVPAPHQFYFVLQRTQSNDDPTHLNPTNWVVAFLGHNSDESQPEDVCVPHP